MSITLTSSNASTAEASTAQLASALPIVIPGALVSMPACQHKNFVPAHLLEPGCSHQRPHLLVVTQHNAGTERAGVAVCRLHKLTSRRRNCSGEMSGPIFVRIAHVKNIKRSRGVGAHPLH